MADIIGFQIIATAEAEVTKATETPDTTTEKDETK